MPYESMDKPDKATYKCASGIDCNKAEKMGITLSRYDYSRLGIEESLGIGGRG